MTARVRAALERQGPRLLLLLTAAVPLSTVGYVLRAYSPLTYSDQWSEVFWHKTIYEGTARISRLWEPYVEHCIFFPRLFFQFDLFAFRGTNVSLLTSSNLLLALSGTLLLRETWRARECSAGVRRFLVGAQVMVLFSAVQIGNLMFGFNVNFILLHTSVVAAIVCYAAYKDASESPPMPRRRRLACSVAAAVVATFSLANGVFIWPVLLLMSFGYRYRGRDTVQLAVVAGAVIALRAAIGFGSVDPRYLLTLFGPFVRFFSQWLASPFAWKSPEAVTLFAVLGAGFAVAFPVYALWRRRRLTRFTTVHLAAAAFVIATGLVTSLGRIGPGSFVESPLVGRYATQGLLFWNSVMSLLVYEAHRLPAGARRVALPLVGTAVAAAIGAALLPAHVRAARAGLSDVRFYERCTLSLITGVYDEVNLKPLWVEPTMLVPAVPFVREKRIGLFSREWAHFLGRPLQELYPIASPAAGGAPQGCVGHFEAVTPVPPPRTDRGPEPGRRVEGWAWDVAAARPSPLILIVDGQGVVRGLALSHVSRRGIEAVFGPQLPGSVRNAGWFGYVTDVTHPPYSAYALSADRSAVYALDGVFPAEGAFAG